jgi:hypothetical protein
LPHGHVGGRDEPDGSIGPAWPSGRRRGGTSATDRAAGAHVAVALGEGPAALTALLLLHEPVELAPESVLGELGHRHAVRRTGERELPERVGDAPTLDQESAYRRHLEGTAARLSAAQMTRFLLDTALDSRDDQAATRGPAG